MKKYIALLRGINVGGKNKVPMTELKILFEMMGFINVITYINSGNVVFASNIENEEKIKTICEKFLVEKFGYNIPVVIISIFKLKKALENVPAWWDNDKQSKHNAIFVIPPFTAKEVIEQIGNIKQEYEKMYCKSVKFTLYKAYDIINIIERGEQYETTSSNFSVSL